MTAPDVASGLIDLLGDKDSRWAARAGLMSSAEKDGFSKLVALDQQIRLGDDVRKLERPHSLDLCR